MKNIKLKILFFDDSVDLLFLQMRACLCVVLYSYQPSSNNCVLKNVNILKSTFAVFVCFGTFKCLLHLFYFFSFSLFDPFVVFVF